MALSDCPLCAGYGAVLLDGRSIEPYVQAGILVRASDQTSTMYPIIPRQDLTMEELSVLRQKFPDNIVEEQDDSGGTGYTLFFLLRPCFCHAMAIQHAQRTGHRHDWRDGSSDPHNAFSRVVRKLHAQEFLTIDEYEMLRIYIAHYAVGSEAVARAAGEPPAPREDWLPALAKAETAGDLRKVLATLRTYGIDPL